MIEYRFSGVDFAALLGIRRSWVIAAFLLAGGATAAMDPDVAELRHLVWPPSQDQIELAVAEEFSVETSELFAKRIRNNEARVAAVYLIRGFTSVSATELADRYGGVCQAAISRTVDRSESQRNQDRRWKQRLCRLQESLRSGG